MYIVKDQYMGRSEMWRLKNSLINSVVFINKKVNFCKVNYIFSGLLFHKRKAEVPGVARGITNI